MFSVTARCNFIHTGRWTQPPDELNSFTQQRKQNYLLNYHNYFKTTTEVVMFVGGQKTLPTRLNNQFRVCKIHDQQAFRENG